MLNKPNKSSASAAPALRRARPALRGARLARGFTLFESMVAMFILLVGILGVTSVFSSGMYARLVAQELIVTQDLANQWADWVRFRLEAQGLTGSIGVAALAAGATGKFQDMSGSLGASTNPTNAGYLPTVGCNAYEEYYWTVASVTPYKPQWMREDTYSGTGAPSVVDWDKRKDGTNAQGYGNAPVALQLVELTIARGSRTYRFQFVFSGVGLKYD